MDLTRKIDIAGVDADSVEKDDSFPAALAFQIKLSDVPDNIWQEIFVSEYEQSWFNLKREVTLHGDRIRVVTAPGEEEKHIDFVKRLVSQTNDRAEEYNREVQRQRSIEERQTNEESKIVTEARERLKKVKL